MVEVSRINGVLSLDHHHPKPVYQENIFLQASNHKEKTARWQI